MPRRHRRGLKHRWGRRMRILEPMMLLLMAQEPLHGYALVEKLSESFNVSNISPQTIYRALQDMEERQWITAEWDVESTQGPPRKVYTVTEAGLSALDAWSEEVNALSQTLDTFLSNYKKVRRR